MAKSPKEFSEAMRDLVVRSQQHAATAVSQESYQMKLRILDFFIARDPDVDSFERMLRERIDDNDSQKELSRGICCQILNSWRSGSYFYTPEGRLVLKALYPAELPPGWEDGGTEAEG